MVSHFSSSLEKKITFNSPQTKADHPEILESRRSIRVSQSQSPLGRGKTTTLEDQVKTSSAKIRSKSINNREIQSIIGSHKPMEQCMYRSGI